MDDLNRVTVDYCVKIYVKRDKGYRMCVSHTGKCRIKMVGQVSEFRYFGSFLSEDGYLL